jgi:hypothetical protein
MKTLLELSEKVDRLIPNLGKSAKYNKELCELLSNMEDGEIRRIKFKTALERNGMWSSINYNKRHVPFVFEIMRRTEQEDFYLYIIKTSTTKKENLHEKELKA